MNRIEVVNPAWAEQYGRALGEGPFCVRYDPRPSPLETPCTGHAEIRVGAAVYCRACAGEQRDQLTAAIEVVDAWDDPRREASR